MARCAEACRAKTFGRGEPVEESRRKERNGERHSSFCVCTPRVRAFARTTHPAGPPTCPLLLFVRNLRSVTICVVIICVCGGGVQLLISLYLFDLPPPPSSGLVGQASVDAARHDARSHASTHARTRARTHARTLRGRQHLSTSRLRCLLFTHSIANGVRCDVMIATSIQ